MNRDRTENFLLNKGIDLCNHRNAILNAKQNLEMQSGLGGAQFGLGDPKWQLPGWRIEQKYATGVLIGNWDEDRLGKVVPHCSLGTLLARKNLLGKLTHIIQVYFTPLPLSPHCHTQFKRGNESGDSTHRTDFRHYSPATYQPDVSTRRRGMLMNNVSPFTVSLVPRLCGRRKMFLSTQMAWV